MNSRSMVTASVMISATRSADSLLATSLQRGAGMRIWDPASDNLQISGAECMRHHAPSCGTALIRRQMLMDAAEQAAQGAHEYSRQAKSQCRPSSREISSLEKVRPGIRPRFLSQKMAQKLRREGEWNGQHHC
jgi:hypothetical protein